MKCGLATSSSPRGILDAREQEKVDGPAAASSSSSSAGAQASEPPAQKAKLDKQPLEALKSSQQGKLKNTFVSVTKAMANSDLLSGARLIASMTSGLALEHGHTAHAMRGPAPTVEYFIQATLFSWLQPLKGIMDILADPLALEYMGLLVEFVGPQYSNLSLQSQLVICDDIHAAKAVRFASELMRHRCSSMSWHTSAYPGLFGAFAQSRQHRC